MNIFPEKKSPKKEYPRLDIRNPQHLIDLRSLKTVRTYSEIAKKKAEIADLVSLLKPINLEDALIKVSSAGAVLFKEEKFHDDRKIITRINVAYLSKLISYYSQLSGGIIANESLLDTACLMCNEYPSDEIKLEKNAAKDFSEYIIRGSQFIHLNDKYRYTLPRTVFIYDEIATEYKSETEIDIPEFFCEFDLKRVA